MNRRHLFTIFAGLFSGLGSIFDRFRPAPKLVIERMKIVPRDRKLTGTWTWECEPTEAYISPEAEAYFAKYIRNRRNET